MSDIEAARVRWLALRPKYEEFASVIARQVESWVREGGYWCQVTSRAKEVDSLIRKLILKPYHTYDSIGDKAGVRVVLRHKDEIDSVVELICQKFACGSPDNKVNDLEPFEMGYLGTHIDVRFSPGDSMAIKYSPGEFSAEVQVRSLAQHLWSEITHDTIYKSDETISPLPPRIKRRAYILAGTIELADDEFSRLRRDIPQDEIGEMLALLERHFFRFCAKRGDHEISRRVIGLLLPVFDQTTQEISDGFKDFLDQKHQFIEGVFRLAVECPQSRSAFLFQPESLLIFQLLERDRTSVRDAWVAQFPERELERLASAFGMSFS